MKFKVGDKVIVPHNNGTIVGFKGWSYPFEEEINNYTVHGSINLKPVNLEGVGEIVYIKGSQYVVHVKVGPSYNGHPTKGYVQLIWNEHQLKKIKVNKGNNLFNLEDL